jgi:tRNA/tmRNA/rRNA uracil-C5-methylase (TrmA/RlmC/RlmD family)
VTTGGLEEGEDEDRSAHLDESMVEDCISPRIIEEKSTSEELFSEITMREESETRKSESEKYIPDETVFKKYKDNEKALLDGFLKELLQLETEGKISGKIVGILHIINDSSADAIKNEKTDILYGNDSFVEELMGLTFEVSAFSFFQTNTYGAEVLYQTVREYAGECLNYQEGIMSRNKSPLDYGNMENELFSDDEYVNDLHLKNDIQPENNMQLINDIQSMKHKTIFDLYCGTGTITQLMSPMAEQVIGVELVEEAVEAARISAERNDLQNCKFIAGDVLHVLDTLTEKPDLIILDPPRDGIHPKALPKLLAYLVEHIIYVSCKPTSLVRDLEVFLASGYRVKKAVAADQFPWTNGVETVMFFSR